MTAIRAGIEKTGKLKFSGRGSDMLSGSVTADARVNEMACSGYSYILDFSFFEEKT